MNPEIQEILEAINKLTARQSAHMEETRRQFKRLDHRLEQGLAENQKSIAENQQGLAATQKELATLTAEVRRAHVLIEDNRSAIELVAEGVTAANERIDSLKGEMNERFDSQETFFRSTIGHLATNHGGRLDRLERRVGLN